MQDQASTGNSNSHVQLSDAHADQRIMPPVFSAVFYGKHFVEGAWGPLEIIEIPQTIYVEYVTTIIPSR